MEDSKNIVDVLYELTREREESPVPGSYTNYLLDKGVDRILAKISEQSVQLILASKNDEKQDICTEAADLLYHLTVLLYVHGVSWDEVRKELVERRKEDA